MYDIVVQRASAEKPLPTTKELRKWASAALQAFIPSAELTIRIVDEEEIIALNSTYRHKTYATNVLSFPFDTPKEMEDEVKLLGDIVICANVVRQEAVSQQKILKAHWAHMVVHGTLHLLGYDHEIDADAALMEGHEIRILESLGFSNPYKT